MKKIRHIIVLIAVFIGALCCISISAYASTITYVGSEVSVDGTITITNSATDKGETIPRRLKLYQKTDSDTALYFDNEFKFSIPDNASKYISVSKPRAFANSNFSDNDAISANGLYVVASTIGDEEFSGNLKAEYVAGMLAMTSTTADDALLYLDKMINEQGAAEGFVVLISDQNESIYAEVTAEKEIISVVLPQDISFVFGERFVIDSADNFTGGESSIDFSKFSTKEFLDYLRADKEEYSYQTLVKIHKDCPATICLEEWVSLYDAGSSQFVGFTNAQTKIPSAYETQVDSIDYDDSAISCICKRIEQITKGNEDSFKNLYSYWDEIENILIKKQEIVFDEAKGYAQNGGIEKAQYLLAYVGSDSINRTANDLFEVTLDVDYLLSKGENISDYDPYVNLKVFAEYYGYSYKEDLKIITVTNGEKTIKMFSPTNYVDLKGNIISSSGMEEGVDAKFYYAGVMVRHSVASKYFNGEPATFDSTSIINTYSESNTNVKNILLFFGGMGVFLVVVSVAFIVINKKKRSAN